ncbi:hypothetical protein TYRP_003585, partial [Tyrophagus putrescentiae]
MSLRVLLHDVLQIQWAVDVLELPPSDIKSQFGDKKERNLQSPTNFPRRPDPPGSLNEPGGGNRPLRLLLPPIPLIRPQRQTGAQNARWNVEGDAGEEGKESQHRSSCSRQRDDIPVANAQHGDHGVVGGVGDVGEGDEDEEDDKGGGQEVLSLDPEHGAEKAPRFKTILQPKDLEDDAQPKPFVPLELLRGEPAGPHHDGGDADEEGVKQAERGYQESKLSPAASIPPQTGAGPNQQEKLHRLYGEDGNEKCSQGIQGTTLKTTFSANCRQGKEEQFKEDDHRHGAMVSEGEEASRSEDKVVQKTDRVGRLELAVVIFCQRGISFSWCSSSSSVISVLVLLKNAEKAFPVPLLFLGSFGPLLLLSVAYSRFIIDIFGFLNEFLIYLQSAQSSDDESDGRNHYKLNHLNNLANLINKNNNSTCREGFLYNGTSGNCTLILPTRFPLNTTTSSTSSTTTAVHIETLELVQTVLLIALPLITILCLFFFCDRLGRYVQKMHHQDVEISFDGEDGGHHPQSLNLYHPHH